MIWRSDNPIDIPSLLIIINNMLRVPLFGTISGESGRSKFMLSVYMLK